MKQNSQKIIIGIDVSKDKLDIWMTQATQSHKVITNNARTIGHWLKSEIVSNTDVMVALEPTGGYEQELVRQLLRRQVKTFLIHPNHLHYYGKSLGAHAKTDKLASKLLAQYLEEKEKTLTPVKANFLENKEFRGLTHRRKQLKQMIHGEQCRLSHSSLSKSIKSSIKRLLKLLKKELASIEGKLNILIAEDDKKEQLTTLLKTFKGVGPIASQTLVIDLPELGQLTRSQISKLLGVAPLNRDSGKKSGHRYIYGGRGHVRNIIYMVAQVAVRFNPSIRIYFEQLRARGKAFKVALVAVMRKIICILNAMVRDQKPWNGMVEA